MKSSLQASLLLCAQLAALPPSSGWGQSAATGITTNSPDTHVVESGKPGVPLGLPRLANAAKAGGVSIIDQNKFSVDALNAVGVTGVTKSSDAGLNYLSLDGHRTWSRPLRDVPQTPSFVSFAVYPSVGTTIRIGDAWLGVVDSAMKNYTQLAVGRPGKNGIDWAMLGISLPTDVYNAKTLATFPVLTVRLDPKTKTWDLYVAARLAATDLPFYTPTGTAPGNSFQVQAGTEGACVLGCVLSDDNPLYEDTNANGVDDKFEKSSRGDVLSAAASAADRQVLMKDWASDARSHPRPVLLATRIRPDRMK